MSRKELLYEQYEAAMFALVLDEIMEREGAGFLEENEHLKNDNSLTLNKAFVDRCFKTIKHQDLISKRQSAIRGAKKMVVRIAVLFLVCFLVFSIPFCTVSAFRTASLNLVIETFDKGTKITADEDHLNGSLTTLSKSPTWFPAGTWRAVFLTNEESLFLIRFEDLDSNVIFYSEIPTDGSMLSIDTEDAEILSDILVYGNKAVMSVKREQVILSWIDDSNSTICTLEVHGSHFIATPDIALRIAESIK